MDEARIFLVVHSKRARSNGLKLECMKFQIDTWKNFFTVRVMEHWNGLPEGLQSLLLWRCSRPTWIPPCCREPALQGGWT